MISQSFVPVNETCRCVVVVVLVAVSAGRRDRVRFIIDDNGTVPTRGVVKKKKKTPSGIKNNLTNARQNQFRS